MKVKKLFVLLIVLLMVLVYTTTAYALSAPYTTKRLGGETRFDTAIEISKEFVSKTKKPVDSVILCTAYGYADSVSVTPFAMYVNAPILLTDRDTLTLSTQARISEMGVKKVYIIGGTGVISDNVMSQLTTSGLTVERIGGYNRFDTNQMILAKIPQDLWGKSPKFVNGYDPYTGLAVAIDTIDKDNTNLINPIILYSNDIDGYHLTSINNERITTTLLKVFGDDYFTPYVQGVETWKSTSAWTNDGFYYVSDDILKNLDGDNVSTFSLGASSTDKDNKAIISNILSINNRFSKRFNSHPYSTNSAMLTTGSNYIDAIAAGPLSAITYCPIIFLDKEGRYSANRIDYLDVQNVYYIGGTVVAPNGSENILN